VNYLKQQGFGLLGMLLFIAIAAVITVASVEAYQAYKKRVETQIIAFDLRKIEQIGMDYYTTVGCLLSTDEKEGSYFAGNADPSWDELLATTGEKLSFATGRDPWVRSYQLKIVRDSERTEDSGEHAHYHLVILAKMKGLNEAELQYLAKRLHATTVNVSDRELEWDHLAFALQGGSSRPYQPLQVSNMGELGFVDQEGQRQASRQYCR
jgi:Tfp pilus assembly protein PilE